MTTRRDFLKTATVAAVAAPLSTLPQFAYAGEVTGEFVLKEINEKTLSNPYLRNWIKGQIISIIKRAKSPDEAMEALKAGSRQFDQEVDRVVKVIGDRNEEEPVKHGIKFKLSFEFPPAKIKLEVTF